MGRLSKEEFCRRFVEEIVRITGGVDGEGFDTRKYAEETAPSYFEDQYASDETLTPEELADTDHSYWED